MSDSFSFLVGRGKMIKVADGNQTGIYKIEGLETDDASGGTIILDSVLIGELDVVSPTDALGDKHILYIFGKTFKEVIIAGTLHVNPCSNSSGQSNDPIKALNDFFSKNRVTEKKESVNVSVGEIAVGVYITDFTLGLADPAYNTILFAIRGFARPRKTS